MHRSTRVLIFLLIICLSYGCLPERNTAIVNNEPWSSWSDWSVCSNTDCGYGTKTRKKQNLLQTEIFLTETESCHSNRTCTYGEWRDWEPWSDCSSNCNGEQIRYRKCFVPPGAKDCLPPKPREMRTCNIPPCVEIVPLWLPWQQWSSCQSSATCGQGQKSRKRECNFSKTDLRNIGELKCVGMATESVKCFLTACPVPTTASTTTTEISTTTTEIPTTATEIPPTTTEIPTTTASTISVTTTEEIEWSSWQSWTACSTSCGLGSKSRIRTRTCPLSVTNCSYKDSEQTSCKEADCAPVNGGFGPWQSWSICFATCGWNKRVRNRLCNSPAPAHNGQPCVGEAIDVEECLGGECPVNGGWGAWTPCSDTVSKSSCVTEPLNQCIAGEARFCRKCNNPLPQMGGTRCVNESPIKNEKCWNHEACDNTVITDPQNFIIKNILGSNDLILEWFRLPYGLKISDFYIQYYDEDLDKQTTAPARKEIIVPVTDNEVLGKQYNLTLTGFELKQLIKVSIKSRHRKDDKMFANGKEISLSFRIGRIDGGFGPWGGWGQCSKQCDFGYKYRFRVCNNPVPQNGGLDCQGNAEERSMCRIRPC